MRATAAQKRRAALSEQIRMVQFVDRVREIEAPQQWIGSHFRRAQDVAAAISFDFAERQELAYAPIEISPHPSMYGSQHVTDARVT